MHPDNKSIGGGGPPAIAMTIDNKAKRLFLSDSGNNRVLVFDVRPDRPEIQPIGNQRDRPDGFRRQQADRHSHRPAGRYRSDAVQGRVQFAGGIAYDNVRDRLFVVDSLNGRVLVFKASPADTKNGMSAYAVIGQKDFISSQRVWLAPHRQPPGGISEEVGRRRFALPSNLAYDPVKDWLYVSDRDNERTVVFDVSEKVLNTDQAALHVFGKDDFVSDAVTRSEQEEIVEPRELVVDAEHQRLYQADTPMAKILVFDLPKDKRPVDLPARAMISYATTDPWNGRDKPERDTRKAWHANITGPAALPGASVVLSNTRQFLDPASERRSRILISETTVMPARVGSEAVFVVDQQDGADHLVMLSNGTTKPINARLAFTPDGTRAATVERSVPAGGQLSVPVSELFGDSASGKSGVLKIGSGQPLAASVVRKVRTKRGEDLYVAMPQVETFQQQGLFSNAEGATIAGVKVGGGYETELVLANTGKARSSGRIELRDDVSGEPVVLPGLNGPIAWDIAPGGVFRTKLTTSSPVAKSLFPVIMADSGGSLPSSSAIVSLRDGDLLLSQTVTPGRPRTQLAWFGVDTQLNLVRHGETPPKMEFSVANPSHWPALVRFTLFDMDGKETGRFEQIMAPDSQRRWGPRGHVQPWPDPRIGAGLGGHSGGDQRQKGDDVAARRARRERNWLHRRQRGPGARRRDAAGDLGRRRHRQRDRPGQSGYASHQGGRCSSPLRQRTPRPRSCCASRAKEPAHPLRGPAPTFLDTSQDRRTFAVRRSLFLRRKGIVREWCGSRSAPAGARCG